jgi:hypothetical protein
MDIQLLLVVLIVIAAAAYLTRRFVMQLKGKKKAGCEKCGIASVKDIK